MPLSQIPRAKEGALFSMNPVLSAAISAARRGLFTWAGHQRALFEEETLPVIWLLTREKNSAPPLVLLPCLCHQVPWICDKQTFGVLSPLGKCRCPQLASFNLGQASPAPACACRGRRERSLALLLQNELWKIKSRGKRGEKKKTVRILAFHKLAAVTLCHPATCWRWPNAAMLQQAERGGCPHAAVTPGQCPPGPHALSSNLPPPGCPLLACHTILSTAMPIARPPCTPQCHRAAGCLGRTAQPHGIPWQGSWGGFPSSKHH